MNKLAKIKVMFTKGHVWTTQNTGELSNLATFLMQLCQLLLMLYLQLCQFLQLSIIPCAIMSWTGVSERGRRDVTNQTPTASVPLTVSGHYLHWIFYTTSEIQVIHNELNHSQLPHNILLTNQNAIIQYWKIKFTEDLIHLFVHL